jgi:RNA polymerase sigma-70 factor (ECF subfamily)
MLKLVKPDGRSAVGREHPPDDLRGLAEAACRGEQKAVRTFVTAIGPSVLRVTRRMFGPLHPDIEDLAQEATLQVLSGLPRYRGECSVLHFVCRVAVHAAMNARRRYSAEKRTGLSYTDTEIEAVPAIDPGPEATTNQRRAMQQVRDLIATLPGPQAEALALHCLLGYTIPEIAQTTGVPAETVRSRLRLAGQSLRVKLQAAGEQNHPVEGVS